MRREASDGIRKVSEKVMKSTPAQESRVRASQEPTATWLRRRLAVWFEKHGRNFVWRRNTIPYHVLVAELLLQRTRADIVEPYFEKFVARFPDAHALAAADKEEVTELLRPLGFEHRSRRLPQLGQALVERHGGQIPTDRGSLMDLPGVGPYVTNVVLSLCFGRRLPFLDPNVIRVVDRVFGIRSQRSRPREDPELWEFVASLTPRSDPGGFGLALVDLGALICRPRRPRCLECPLRARCNAYQSAAVEPARTRIA
jgi:A/G-specific adenine glycosylase